MKGLNCDIAIVGGGLAGGLIALALALHRPELRLRLIEAGGAPGGNHRWSWFASDLDAEGTALMERFPITRWDRGYSVAFPGFARDLTTPYRSLSSADFADTLRRELAEGTILAGIEVTALDATGVTLAGGQRIAARAVVDCRGFAPSPTLSGGWQVFMGRHLRLARPHGLDRPIVMDAQVEQIGGYRFLYVLPLTPEELFLEDTYYQDTPVLDQAALSGRLDAYAARLGWQGETIGTETGVLPVITGGEPAGDSAPGVALAGARGGFAHPLTSYTLPFAVQTALAMTQAADLPGEELAALLKDRARRHRRAMAFYRLLGRMLFGAARPAERYRVFARFYRLPESLIERFYAGRSTMADRARILCGRPPVPIGRAIGALTRPQPMLKEAA